MLITVLAVGSQGDVLPLGALAGGLTRLGHTVRLATHDTFRGIAERAGLEFARIAGNPMEIVHGDAGQAWLASVDNPLLFMARVSRVARDILDKLNDDALQACRGSDAVIYSLPLALSGHTMAEALGVPGIPAALYPLHPTRDFPSIMTPTLRLGGALNWTSGWIVQQLFWRVFRSHQNRWRRSRLGLPPLPVCSPLAAMQRDGVPMLYGYSPSILPLPEAWIGSLAVSGFWFSSAWTDWSPPKDLLDFLEAGSPPLYVGFGSMASADPGRTAEVISDSLARTGQRAVLAAGWGGVSHAGKGGRVFSVEHVPHGWLFPRVAAAVHHGGAGTTAAALRAGVPSIIVPFFADQFFWGSRIQALGLGPRPIPKKKLTADALTGAIGSVLSDPGMRERCRAMAARIGAEQGIEAAAAIADRYLRSTTSRRIH
jgi:sterol 3beta-glucosyltransferase